VRNTIVISVLGLALFANGAAAQTAAEKARILGDFQRSVTDYTQRHHSLDMLPEAPGAATAPKVFTPPVAVVFRQLIANAMSGPGTATIGGAGATHRATVLQPHTATDWPDFPPVLTEALPPLPAPLEYRLVDDALVIRDTGGDVIVAVLNEALGLLTTRR
jgi:hypothetical protein